MFTCPASLSPATTFFRPAPGPRAYGPARRGTPGVCGPLCALALCTVCALPCEALASYEEHLLLPAPLKTQKTPGVVTAPEAGLFEEGPQGPVPEVTSQGTHVPLAYALSLLTPRGWICHGAHQASKAPVSWTQDEDWLKLLTRLARETQSAFLVDWTQKTLTVRQAAQPAPASSGAAVRKEARAKPQAPGQKSAQKSARASAQNASAPTLPQKADREPHSAAQAPARTDAQVAPGPRIVSLEAGAGRVFLAYGMSVQEAARVLDTPIKRLMRWNHLQKDAFLPKGTALWLRDPALVHAQASSAKTAKAATPARTTAEKTDLKTDQKPASTSGQKTIAAAVPARRTASAQVSASARTTQTGQNTAQTVWTITPGLLKQQLETWAAQAGYQVVWAPDTDMELEAQATFQGPFSSAVRALFEGLYAQGSPFTARLYHGNRILKVEDR